MTNERACPVCNSVRYSHFSDERIDQSQVGAFTYASRKTPEFMSLRLVCCKNCDLVYAPSPPSEHFLQAAYTEAGYDSHVEAWHAARTYADALEKNLQNLSGRNAAIDIGTGSGPLLPYLLNKGFSPVIGIEPSTAAIEAAPQTLRPLIREGMFTSSMLEGVTPSLICSFMILEHLNHPGNFVTDVYQLLEPGGAFAVAVHNWRAPVNRLLGMRSPIIDVEHLQLFSPKSLCELLKKAGFVKIKICVIRNRYPLRYWLRLTPLPMAIKDLIDRILQHGKLIDRPLTVNVGNIFAVGLKPEGQVRSKAHH
jgi:SAM-dependent methyltransferase